MTIRFPLLFGVVLLLLVALFLPTLRGLAQVWWADPNYSHGFLIPVFTGWLVWDRLRRSARATVEPSAWGAPWLVLALLLLVAGTMVEAVGSGRGGLFVRGVSLVLVLLGLVLFLLGPTYLRRLAFPLAYLIFMVPLPVGLFAMVTLPLQLYASDATTAILRSVGIPALREGNIIHLPSTTLGVTEACSGIRSLLSLIAGAVGLSVFTQKLWWERVVLVASVVPIVVVMNAFRITSTGLLAHYIGLEIAEGFFHGFSSWLILLSSSAILCAEILVLERLVSTPNRGEGPGR